MRNLVPQKFYFSLSELAFVRAQKEAVLLKPSDNFFDVLDVLFQSRAEYENVVQVV